MILNVHILLCIRLVQPQFSCKNMIQCKCYIVKLSIWNEQMRCVILWNKIALAIIQSESCLLQLKTMLMPGVVLKTKQHDKQLLSQHTKIFELWLFLFFLMRTEQLKSLVFD